MKKLFALILVLALVGVGIAWTCGAFSNKADTTDVAQAETAVVAEPTVDPVAQAESDAAAIRAAAEADAADIRAAAEADAEEIRAEAQAQVPEDTFFFEEDSAEAEVEDDAHAYEQITFDGQQIFVGDSNAIIDYLSSLNRQDWLDLAVIAREGECEYYARVLPWQSEVMWNGAFASAYRMTSNQYEYAILRNGALLVQDAQGQVVVDYSTTKVSGVNDRTYPRNAYSEQDEALYESKVLAKGFTLVYPMGTLKVSSGFDRQEMFRALVVAEGDFWAANGEYVHGYFIAWRIVEGPAHSVVVTNPPTTDPTTPPPTSEPTVQPTAQPTSEPTAQPTAQPTSEPTAQPTAQPTSEPTAQPTAQPTSEPTAQPTAQPTPTPAHSTPEPENEPAHSTPEPEPEHSEPTAKPDNGVPTHTEPTGDFTDSNENPVEVMGDDREPAKPDNGVPTHTEPTGDFVDSSESAHEVMDRASDAPRHAPVADDGGQQESSSDFTSTETSVDEVFGSRHAPVADTNESSNDVSHSSGACHQSEDDFSSSDELSAFWG